MKFRERPDGLVEVVDSKDQVLFMHCAAGMVAVTKEYFDNHVEPLLFIHGVSKTEWDWDRGD